MNELKISPEKELKKNVVLKKCIIKLLWFWRQCFLTGFFGFVDHE